ncbi:MULTISPECIES: LysM peptidoglycan-binding domain-containing protein [Mesobacillus]|uniref:C40 family peptidase n=1 Tax=Mesobacillus TaxID=2675231 RepID=UPI00177DFA58|nr:MULTISPECIES: peptidoglycan endopeptidase [Mesobacillus]MCM3573985.1 LysM peptidoglycan-binding domain-containing protein [Mesobacillus subterraneus]UYZ20255.1 LysM peptidoglycan-binding domain-containing protein [Mesobacillus jeotgali]
MKKQLLTVAATAGILFTSFNGSASAHDKLHTVQSGDSLWKLSNIYNVTINDIQKWNNLSSSTIYVNQKLSVLAPHSHSTDASTAVGTSGSTYVVKTGDTLWGISKSYGMSISGLKSLNGLKSDVIHPGQKLKVSGTAATTASTAPASSSSTYTVRSGDNLSTIAARHNLSLSQLMSINNLKSHVIFPGQVLKLSGSASTPVATNVSSANTPVMATYGSTSKVNSLIAESKKYIGVPYVWAGSTPAGFDCSGYLNYAYSKVGISIPRTVASIWDATKPVSSPRVGDLVFFETYKPGPSHAGIYLGDGKFIHAGSSRGVEISDMNNSYWKPRYLGAKTTF